MGGRRIAISRRKFGIFEKKKKKRQKEVKKKRKIIGDLVRPKRYHLSILSSFEISGEGGNWWKRKCISGAYVHRDRRTIMQSVPHFKCRNANYHLWWVPPPPPGNTSVQDARGYTRVGNAWMVYAGSDTALFHENSSLA